MYHSRMSAAGKRAIAGLTMFALCAAVVVAEPGAPLIERLNRIEQAIDSLATRATTVRFNRDVRPILSEHCFKCHGPDEKQRKAGLRLDVEDAAREALAPGRPEASKVLKRVRSHDSDERMPPPSAQSSLTEAQIETLATWIAEGAPYERHWAFIKPTRPQIPIVRANEWPRNPIDNFILHRLEEAGVSPSEEANRRVLIRRAYLDLTGLPPTPDAVEAFAADPAPDAYEKVVDALLASPHFGERWGRHWLDGARYADSDGYGIDNPRNIWKYRDWVIDAFNSDMPFDRFTIAQLAGDLLPDGTRDDLVATGFHRNTLINQEGGVDAEEFRVAAVIDRVNTTGTVFLGLTLGCAQCHSHKYDPVSQEEYYRFFAFFNSDDDAVIDLPKAEEEEALRAAQARVAEAQQSLDSYIRDVEDYLLAQWEQSLSPETRATFVASVQQGLNLPRADRHPDQTAAIRAIFFKDDPEYAWRSADLKAAKAAVPNVPSTMVLRKRIDLRDTFIHVQGDFTRKGDKVEPGMLAFLHRAPTPASTLTRLDLARWIVHPDNPLTARVTVNRIWMHLFGRGIVETENDFGTQGTPPTHPDLLDWLATEFMAREWSMKSMIRLIVTSATYRQSSNVRPDLDDIDPQNRLLARQSRLRLEAEILRDNALAVSGLLNPAIGGPSVFPPQPDGIMSQQKVARTWTASEGPDRYRRGMYTFFWRASPHPSLILFDAPDAIMTCTRRNRSNTPLQALSLLNEASCVEAAQYLGARILRDAPQDDAARIAHAFRVCLGRDPREREAAALHELLRLERAAGQDDAGAMTSLARVMLNLDEFITRE